MSTTPQDLANKYVGRHRNLSPELAAHMTTELTGFVTWTSGKPAKTFADHMAGCTTCTKACGTQLALCPVGRKLADREQELLAKIFS